MACLEEKEDPLEVKQAYDSGDDNGRQSIERHVAEHWCQAQQRNANQGCIHQSSKTCACQSCETAGRRFSTWQNTGISHSSPMAINAGFTRLIKSAHSYTIGPRHLGTTMTCH